jgi:hypothetical protein
MNTVSPWRARLTILQAFATVAALCMLAAAPVRAEDSELRAAITKTKPIVDLRLRSETVDQDGIPLTATAVTLRGRLGFQTGNAWKTSLLAEAQLLTPLNSDYNDTLNHKTQYPVVADPETYTLNRLQLTNTTLPGTTVILGRQRVNLDDQRFVGNSGWRQNEQTFDALRVTNKSIDSLTLDFLYLNQVNRVYGPDSPVGSYRGETFLGNAAYQTPFGKLTGFAYLLDFNEALGDSSQTFGVRFAGSRALHGVTLAYTASYAYQQEYADNPLNYDDDYYAFELGATYRGVNLSAGLDILGGNGVKGFSTPIATLHKFQGTADKFLTTPANGIDDRYVTLAYAPKSFGDFNSLTASVTYHQFDSERLALDYGSEIDAQLQLTFRRFALMFKYADYQADTFATDTSKFWLQLEFVH